MQSVPVHSQIVSTTVTCITKGSEEVHQYGLGTVSMATKQCHGGGLGG
jgi:hypothetical protein